jgi:4-hydroxybenzoate polyprenyltransferase
MMLASMWVFPYFCLVWLIMCIAAMYYYTCATMQTYQLMARDRMLELKSVVKTYTNSWQMRWALLGLGALGVLMLVFKKKVKQIADIDVFQTLWNRLLFIW